MFTFAAGLVFPSVLWVFYIFMKWSPFLLVPALSPDS